MQRFLLICLVATLAACGHSHRERQGDAPAPARVAEANFRDSDPHPWADPSPYRYPVHGIDLSKFQTSVNWAEARDNGVNFAFIKATEGGDQADPMFEDHWRGARRAGVAVGAYHFYYHCRPAIEQARWFIEHVPRAPGALPPVLDMEWTPTSPTCRIRRDPETIKSEARIFLNAVEAHYGQRPIIYTTVDFYRDNAMSTMAGTEFWLRSVAANPKDVYAGQTWKFWQYTSTGIVPGIAGDVDVNVFNGSKAAWEAWRASHMQ
ncbi:MAG: glycoside hydrolase family 25 protein [Rhodobacteraceae bacterium]|nr:glycoside hydrolase family 25 protein [Paracoccaceae bacterium]